MGIFEKFKIGFQKSASNLTAGLKEIILKKEIDDHTLNKIEDFLISSDVGVDAASDIKDIISQNKIDPSKDIIDEVNSLLKKYILSLMQPLERKDFFNAQDKLNIILVSGVNGVGKTTSIGKIGKRFRENNSKVLFSACDTFRAAAIDQLEQWANKINVEIVKSDPGSDPASVAFKSLDEAKKNNYNQVIIDTAGRLQNKKNLMEEYKKIAKVINKFDDTGPHEVLLVLDATSGQNVINQVEEFNKIIPLTGLIMTKLDGTAKGGILIATAKRFKIPIVALGLGEKEDDLEIFDSESFASAFVRTN
jgi:fused signal recognition particle receptor